MAIEPHEEPGVADQFVDMLARDAGLRQRYLDAQEDEDAVAGVIGEATGKNVEASNLTGIANHLHANRADVVAQFANDYPAMNVVMDGGV